MVIKLADKGWVIETKTEGTKIFTVWDNLVDYLEDKLTDLIGVDHPTRLPKGFVK